MMTTKKTPFIERLRTYDTTSMAVLAYCLLYGLGVVTGLNLYFLPGLMLMLYLPGRQLMDLYSPLQKPWGAIGQAALAVFLSVSLVVSLQIVLNRFGITPITTTVPVLGINAVLIVARKLKRGRTRRANLSAHQSPYTVHFPSDLLPLLIVFATLGVTVLLSPYPADADGFLTALQKSVECHCVSIGFRQTFVSYQALAHFVLGLPLTVIFRLFFPMLFFISTGFVFDYALRRITVKKMAYIAYLSILIAPVVLSEANIIRPQVGMLAYTLPILMLVVEAWRSRSMPLSLVSVWFSLIAIGFHELSIVLLIITLIPCSIIGNEIRRARHVSWVHIALAAILLLPYLKIFDLNIYFSKLGSSIRLAMDLFPPIHWRWWFINNYVTIDGFNLGWPGVQALHYYAYSGLQLLLFGAFMVVWRFQRQAKLHRSIMLPLLYASIFLFFAEVLPRMGFFFLPNRAWVHLALALVVMMVMLYEGKEQGRVAQVTMFQFPIFLIVLGVIGTVYVAYNNVSEIFREEIKSLRYIQSTPENSLFLSTQDNHTLVQFYGGRRYAPLAVKQKLNRSQFDHVITQRLDILKEAHRVEISPELREEVRQYENDKLVSTVIRVLVPRQFSVTEAFYSEDTPVYFIYSLRKSSGVNAARGYNGALVDIINKDTYQNIEYEPVYRDESVIILKLR